MATKKAEVFSVTHAQILDGSTSADNIATNDDSWGDIYGVEEASLTTNVETFENRGDDKVLSRWNSFNFAEVNVKAGYLSFELMSRLAGTWLSSTGSGDTEKIWTPLWHEKALNVSPKPMLVRTRSKDSAGVIRTLDFVLYRVEFKPIAFEGPRYRDGLKINYSGTALLSGVDETGATIGDGGEMVGRLVSRGAV